jgi:hypothetical protein
MKIKVISILIVSVMISSAFIVSADVKRYEYDAKSPEENEIFEIRVAVYDNNLNVNNDKESSGGKFLIFPLRDYEWQVGYKKYYFTIESLTTRDILRGKLKTKDYDALIYSWEQADTNIIYTGFSNLPRNKIREKRIRKFIEDGGGYYGSCGGALIAGDMINKPKNFFERAMKKSCLGISCFGIEYHPFGLLSQIMGFPAKSGLYGYLGYSGYKIGPGANPYSGVPADVNISKGNPIFDDVVEDTRRINWISAPAFISPDEPDREIMVLARFPEEEFSDNDTIKINQWRYTGGLFGLLKAFIRPGKGNYWNDNLGRLMDAWVFSTDWENTGNVTETNISNKPFMTAEIYPNPNQARIVRSSGHPEFGVCWGGHIEEVNDNDKNNIYEGFYRWVNITPYDETIEDEKTYNYFVIRRVLAWASKIVNDNDLPPVYGPSQVSDIYPYEQSSNFNIEGNVEKAEGICCVDLYYRYSPDNTTSWSNWTFYKTDSDDSDGWSWDFDSPNGTGFYEFYSIRNVNYEGYKETEKAPFGPDAIAYVQD